MHLFTAQQRAETVTSVSRLLADDRRIEAAALVGSLAGEADRWSDIDIAVAVAAGADPAAVARDWVGLVYDALSVLHHFEAAFGETLVRGFLLDNLLELDLSFEAVDTFSIWGRADALLDRSGRLEAAIASPTEWRPGSPDWKAEAGFAWHDIVHACTAVWRRRPWQGLWYLQRIRNRTLQLAQQRRGFYADFFDYVDGLPRDELEALEETLVSTLDSDQLLRAIEAATRAFLKELHHGDASLSARLRPLIELTRLREGA